MIVTLPNGQSATIIEQSAITERQSRAIAGASMLASATAGKLNAAGFDNDKPETWGAFGLLNEAEKTALSDFQATLIVTLVEQWSLTAPITMDSALDLDKATFDQLSEACLVAFNGSDVSAEPAIDPKALTSDSPD